jgi:cytochrome c peroxidase
MYTLVFLHPVIRCEWFQCVDEAFAITSVSRRYRPVPLSPASKNIVNKNFVNVGKALAAYQRTLTYEPTRFDRFAQELQTEASDYSLNDDELTGLKLFINSEKTQCLQCHNGPLFTNRGFHNVGTGGLHGERLDFGRMVGLQAVIQDEFNCLGEYRDAMPEECSSLRFLNRSAHMPVHIFMTDGLQT